MTATAQDPGELFDLCTADGAPLGRTKPRALVHRDGDYYARAHRSIEAILAGRPEPAWEIR